MLDITNLVFRIAGRSLFDNASAQIQTGHRVGLVGRNGAGKSTLLKLVAGELEPDGGSIRLPKEARLGMVAQEAPGGANQRPLDLVLAAAEERAALLRAAETASDPVHIAEIQSRLSDIGAHAAPARAAVILAGLGFDAEMQERPMASFSGGWRMRVALAAALFAEPDLLLLDEPTNHLDLEAALWLENFLRAWPRGLLMVSHDRDFLNAVCTGILHLENQKLTYYRGDYDTFERVRREKLAQTQAAIEKQEAQRSHMQAFIDRFRAKASKARQAQSRLKALARMEPLAAIARDPAIRFHFPRPEALSPPLMALDAATVGYSPGKPILQRCDLRLDPDDRVALLGANGNGKTTLARLIAGRLPALTGTRTAPGKLRIGFFAQHQVEELDLTATPVQLMTRLTPGARIDQVRAKLGGFGFNQVKADTRVESLSGGEKARLTLALITHHAPHLLILDEPTNHLDIDAREALVEALADYRGAVVLISHDRHLVELVADQLWLVENGAVHPFDGDMDDYRRRILAAKAAERSQERAERKSNQARRDRRRQDADARAQLVPLRKAAKTAEAAVNQLTREKARLDAALADPGLYQRDPGRVAELIAAQATAAAALEAAETHWLELAEKLDWIQERA